MKYNMIAIICAFSVLLPPNTHARVSPEQAARLEQELTPMGAQRGANEDGSIPAWGGGLSSTPGSEGSAGDNPFAHEQPMFEIHSGNVDQYQGKLSAGQVAMLRKYSDYKIRVFPTHRTAGYEDYVYEAVRRNATATELVAGGNGLTPYEVSTPFPIPGGSAEEKALQIIWNHITRWRGGSLQRHVVQMTPLTNGQFTPVKFTEQLSYRTALADYSPDTDSNVIYYFKQEITAPARLAGNVLLVHETLDQVKEPRRAWIYNSGQRRVRRAPQVAYDGPGTASDGQRTTDNFDMFNGAPDRYDWALIGKRELYIPYNSYQLNSKELKYADIIQPGHINQELARYELHRVWVIEATLKSDARHIYAKRVFYVDEDSWQIALVDHYDGRGELWRVAEGHQIYHSDQKISWYTAEVLYDLLSGRYLALGLTNEEPRGYVFDVSSSSEDFTPAALRRAGRR